MKRPSRERERPAAGEAHDDQGLDPRTVARVATAPRPVPQPPSSWARRNWVSIMGLTVGLLASIWKFGIPQFPRDNRMGPRGGGGMFAAAPFEWHGPIAAGHHVEVKGMSGAVRAVAADGDELEVTAIRRSRGVDPKTVPIAVVQEGGDITVCPATPGAPNECAEGEFMGPGGGVSVDYTVRVPKGVLFSASTVNGGITVDGLTAAVEVETVNGGIEISTTGSARAETVNGSIRARVGSTTEDLSFETVNGSIAVSLPENAALDVNAETMSGGISSDFPLNIEKAKPGQSKRASGRIGAGGHDLSMETVNGSIEIQKSSGPAGDPPRPPRPPREPRPARGR